MTRFGRWPLAGAWALLAAGAVAAEHGFAVSVLNAIDEYLDLVANRFALPPQLMQGVILVGVLVDAQDAAVRGRRQPAAEPRGK